MIKCFVVENLDSNTPRGKFDRSYYVAKISNNNPLVSNPLKQTRSG